MTKTYAVALELKSAVATINTMFFVVATNSDEAIYLAKLEAGRTYAMNDNGQPLAPQNVDEVRMLAVRAIDNSVASSLTDEWRIDQVSLTFLPKVK